MRLFRKGDAELSPCGRYRWWLRRYLDGGNGEVVCFVMLNPSTADAEVDDPTIRRCMGFARSWGYSIVSVRNLFAWRAIQPKALLAVTAEEAIGQGRNDLELLAGMSAHRVVCAWGAFVPYGRDAHVLKLLQGTGTDLWCLGTTKEGKPRHPLYVPSAQPLMRFGEAVPS